MKRLLKYILVVMSLILTLPAMISCSGNDDDKIAVDYDLLNGIWLNNKTEANAHEITQKLVFSSNDKVSKTYAETYQGAIITTISSELSFNYLIENNIRKVQIGDEKLDINTNGTAMTMTSEKTSDIYTKIYTE